jgi:lysophospholipase L1-like esterase
MDAADDPPAHGRRGPRRAIPLAFGALGAVIRGTKAQAILSIAALLVLVSCGPQRADAPQPDDYVAMGSSFAAGPGVGHRDPGSPLACGRSDRNYAHLVAAQLGMKLKDVTSSRATIADILTDRQARQPPQIDALNGDVRLVTVTVGGNDVGYLGNLAGWSCANARNRVPLLWRPVLCKVMRAVEVERSFVALPGRFGRMLDEIRRRAPRARIVVVDYMEILPLEGACPTVLPLDEEQLAIGRRTAARLAAITRQVTEAKGATLVPASRIARGHDVCSSNPWEFGLVYPAVPLAWGPFGFHPRERAMRAIAAAVAKASNR